MHTEESRDLWHLIESVHAVTYFAPACRSGHLELGFRGFWMSYFATRSAPMGPVGAGVVTATFANFEPTMVKRAIPDAWTFCTPERAVEGRAEAAASALREAMPDIEDVAADTSGLLDRAIEHADPTGRALFAANLDVIPFEDPVADLWQMCTTLREHRGDGHVATLVSEGLSGCEPHLFAVARTGIDPEVLRAARGWNELEWAEATSTLVGAGLLDADGLTERGAAFHDRIESRTDDLAAPPYAALGEDGRERLRDNLIPVAAAVTEAGWLPFPNPVGLPQVV